MEVLDFYSDSCRPCSLLAIDLDEIIKETGIRIKKLNIFDYYELTEKYNIRSVPTVVFLKNSEATASYCGYKGKDDLMKFIRENIC